MFRVTALVAAGMFLIASPAFAQTFKPVAAPAQASAKTVDFSAKAAGLHAITPAPERAIVKATAPKPPRATPVLKRPLTWVLIGVGAATVIWLASRDGGSGY